MSLKKNAELATPHATFASSDGRWEWRVLKAYSTPKGEQKNPHARWFCAVRSPLTFGGFEFGDCYAADVRRGTRFVGGTEEWAAAYPGDKA